MEKYISVNKLNIKSVHYYDATVMTVVYYNDEIQTPSRTVSVSYCKLMTKIPSYPGMNIHVNMTSVI